GQAADRERVGEQADAEDDRVVGEVQRRDEPQEADPGHERPAPVLRPPPPRVEAGSDERPAQDRAEDGPRAALRLVVARQGDREGTEAYHERGDRQRDQCAPERPHARTALMAAPDRSALWTK